jgi:hypothetical protein
MNHDNHSGRGTNRRAKQPGINILFCSQSGIADEKKIKFGVFH